MNEFGIFIQFERNKFFSQEILDGFDIMIGYPLNGFDPDRVFLHEIFIDVPDMLELRIGDHPELREGKLAKSNKIFNFCEYAVPNDRGFREIGCKWFRYVPVPAVDRGYGMQFKSHVKNDWSTLIFFKIMKFNPTEE